MNKRATIQIYPFRSRLGNTATHPRILRPDEDHETEEFLTAADKFVYVCLFSLAFSFVTLAIGFLLIIGERHV